MKRPKLFLLALTCLLVADPAAGQEFRPFTDQQGRVIKARLTRVQGETVGIVREDGTPFTLNLSQLSAADQDYVRSQAAVLAAGGQPGAHDDVTPEQLNEAAGLSLFTATALWERPAEEVAKALRLRGESKTNLQSSYRAYPGATTRLFGARPYSLALYAAEDKVTSLSVVYANKGDSFSAKGSGEEHFDKEAPPKEAARILREAMSKDMATLTAALQAKLGEPQRQRFGEGEGRRTVCRWDWRGHALLLSETDGEYVGFQIETIAFADSGGRIKRTPEAAVKARALANVEKRDNGDVVIGDIPMVDQGPKGYCVPATAERAMRYLDVPADMYVLAMAGGSGYGGGTSVQALLEGVERDLRRKGRGFERWKGELKLRDLAKRIDRGVPIIWSMHSTKEFNERANGQTTARKGVTDWKEWTQKLAAQSKQAPLKSSDESGHVVLIIGYNKDTNEIAFSDSWGERYKERWIALPDAEKISSRAFWTVGF